MKPDVRTLHGRIPEYTIIITKTSFSSSSLDIELLVYERFIKFHSAGGASFKAIAHDETYTFLCIVDDYFNGTYNIHCMFPRNCARIEISLMFFNFTQFTRPNTYPLRQTLFNETVCANEDMSKMETRTVSYNNALCMCQGENPIFDSKLNIAFLHWMTIEGKKNIYEHFPFIIRQAKWQVSS